MNELVSLIGGLGLLLPVLVGLALLLYLVPIPLWIAAWASEIGRASCRERV